MGHGVWPFLMGKWWREQSNLVPIAGERSMPRGAVAGVSEEGMAQICIADHTSFIP